MGGHIIWMICGNGIGSQ